MQRQSVQCGAPRTAADRAVRIERIVDQDHERMPGGDFRDHTRIAATDRHSEYPVVGRRVPAVAVDDGPRVLRLAVHRAHVDDAFVRRQLQHDRIAHLWQHDAAGRRSERHRAKPSVDAESGNRCARNRDAAAASARQQSRKG
jgi:hypothetical protein